MRHEQTSFSILPRASSCNSSKNIIPFNYLRSTSIIHDPHEDFSYKSIPIHKRRGGSSPIAFQQLITKTHSGVSALLKSLLNIISFPSILPTCMWLNLSITPSLGRKVTGTFFGYRRGLINFVVQENPMSKPVFLIEFAISTSTLVKDMSSALVRIALECDKGPHVRLFQEPRWTMYCNGRKCGYALSRVCNDSDWHVLRTVQSVSVGAGVIPVVDDGRNKSESEGELLYMRARFERVIGNHDSEAFYMMNIDGNGGPELSIFLLRM